MVDRRDLPCYITTTAKRFQLKVLKILRLFSNFMGQISIT